MSFMVADEVTVSTRDNEQFQDEMIEDLFGPENFSDMDTCVEIMSASVGRGMASVTSRFSRTTGSYRSVSSTISSSRKPKKDRYSSPTVSSSSKPTTKASLGNNSNDLNIQLEPVDEDIHKMVREDVRKMIAKIRSSKQPQPQQSHDLAEDDLDITISKSKYRDASRMAIRPGKYGEGDLRSSSSIARKQLFAKIKKDKIKKRKTLKKSLTSEEKVAGSEQREGYQEKDRERNQKEISNREMELSSKASHIGEKFIKKNYYQNKPQESPEHFSSIELTSKQKSHVRHHAGHSSNASVASSKKTVSSKNSTAPIKRTMSSNTKKRQPVVESALGITPISETTPISIISRPQFDVGNKEADDSEPIECVLALPHTSEDDPPGEYDAISLPNESMNKENDAMTGIQKGVYEVVQPETASEVSNEKETSDDDQKEYKSEPNKEKNTLSESKGETERIVQSDLKTSAKQEPAAENVPRSVNHANNNQTTTPSKRQTAAIDSRKNAASDDGVRPVETIESKEVIECISKIEECVQTPSQEESDAEQSPGTDTDDGTVEFVLVDDAERVKRLEYENARLKETLHFLQRTAVEKEKYFAELAWFGKRSEEEVQKWRPNFWKEKLQDFGPELFEEFRADALRIADPDIGDWEHGFSSGSLAMARLLLGLSHAIDDEKICAFHDPGQPCTSHCVTCTVAEQRKRELDDFPVLDP